MLFSSHCFGHPYTCIVHTAYGKLISCQKKKGSGETHVQHSHSSLFFFTFSFLFLLERKKRNGKKGISTTVSRRRLYMSIVLAVWKAKNHRPTSVWYRNITRVLLHFFYFLSFLLLSCIPSLFYSPIQYE